MFVFSRQKEYELLSIVSVIAFLIVLYLFTGRNCFSPNKYQTYAFQAESWTQGRLDLEENYSWLEIAEYNGKYYCSFPPFPSYVLFPFAFVFGHDTPDAFILLLFNILAVLFLFKIARFFNISPEGAMLSALAAILGSNMTFIMFDPSVWFIAQTMCFSLSCASIFFALKNKAGISLALWACAVGCRPMIVVFLPVLLATIVRNELNITGWSITRIRKYIIWCIPVSMIAISYMLLNYFRFGSITEFGHNYLPEFVEVHKQFSFEYIPNNFKMLMNIPEFDEYGRMEIDHFGNINFIMVNTIVFTFIINLLIVVFKREKKIVISSLLILLMSVAYLVFVMCHATMGGWHFGNRYSNEIIPFIYLGLMLMFTKNRRMIKWQIPILIWGMGINLVGTVVVYNGLR